MHKGWMFAGLVAPQVLGAVAVGQIEATAVDEYTPGVVRRANGDSVVNNHQNELAALGAITGNTGPGYAVNPFNPPFAPADMVIIGEGGRLTLQLSQEIPANGRHLGVFSNNGYRASSGGQTYDPVTTIADPQFPSAIVSVSYDGSDWRSLNGGAAVTFTNPTNRYLDTEINGTQQELGAVLSNPAKPYLGSVADMGGLTYGQIRTELNGAAGGDWLDLRGAGLPSVKYVRFDVPEGAGRMVVDAVSGLPAAKQVVAGERIISLSVGSGDYTSNIVIDFGPQSYQFEVHHDGQMTGLAALELLALETDYELSVKDVDGFGRQVIGHDFGGFAFLGDGLGDTSFWGYYVGDGDDWSFASTGPADRLLSDGSYDGWVWSGLQDGPPDFSVAIPEPAALSVLMAGALLLRRRRL